MADWQKGDLALCVNTGPYRYPDGSITLARSQLVNGRVYSVEAFVMDGVGIKKPALILSEVKSHAPQGGFAEWRFRKITPGHKVEGFEEPRRVPVKEKHHA